MRGKKSQYLYEEVLYDRFQNNGTFTIYVRWKFYIFPHVIQSYDELKRENWEENMRTTLEKLYTIKEMEGFGMNF